MYLIFRRPRPVPLAFKLLLRVKGFGAVLFSAHEPPSLAARVGHLGLEGRQAAGVGLPVPVPLALVGRVRGIEAEALWWQKCRNLHNHFIQW